MSHGALDLRDHDHVELVADLGDERRQVVEHPGRLERVDARPQLRVAEVDLPADPDQALARGLLAVDRDGVLEVAEQDVGLRRDVGQLGHHLLVARRRRSGSSATGVTGISRSGSGAPTASGLTKSRGLRMATAGS